MRILKKKKKKYLSEKVLRFEDVFKRIYALASFMAWSVFIRFWHARLSEKAYY